VLWDLPLDPDLLEQRIGRLDRIGQTQPIQIHHHALHGSAQHALARWYDEGCNAFRSSPADGRALLRRFGTTLRELALAHARGAEDADLELDALIAETRAAHIESCTAIEQGRDRLLELAAQRGAPAQALLHALRTEDSDAAQADFALRLLEQYGVHHDAFEDGSVLLDPEYLTTDALPELKGGPLRATFQRDVALAREELALLRLDHPLLLGALDLLLGSELGNASFLVDDTLPARSAVLQAVFVLECVAARALDVDRFLPPTPLTISIDSRLTEREAFTPADNALRRASEKPLDPARYRKFLGRLVPPMLERAQQLARAQADAQVADAQARMGASLAAEITRLQALRRVNPSVRADELDGLRTQRDALAAALDSARLRLDAVRFVVSLDFLTLK
jgi:ATP-dependent helicase HepA